MGWWGLPWSLSRSPPHRSGRCAGHPLQNTLGYSASIAGLAGLPFSLCVIAGSMVGPDLRAHRRQGDDVLGAPVVAASASLPRESPPRVACLRAAGAALSGLGLGCASVASTARGTSAVEESAVWPQVS